MKYIFIYIVLLAAAASCKKDDGPCHGKYSPYQYTSISAALNTYKFKENSYWVYQNDATAQIDSQRVVSAGSGEIGSGGGSSCSNGTYAETYEMRINCSLNNQYFDYYILGHYLSKKTYVPGNLQAYIFTDSFSQNYDPQLLETIPSMTVNGNNFQNVKKVKVESGPHDIIYYFVNSIGIIKWEVVPGSTVQESWSIQSWQVFL